jgi:hypothetical protein
MTNEEYTPLTDAEIEEYASKVWNDIEKNDGTMSPEMFSQMMEEGKSISDEDQNKIVKLLQEKANDADQSEPSEEGEGDNPQEDGPEGSQAEVPTEEAPAEEADPVTES